MTFRPHFRCEVSILLVCIIITAVGQKRHCLDRECEDIIVPLFIEPVHEMFLEPGQCLPFWRSAVREAEIAEHALEVWLVEIADVPENGLIASVAGRHIHRVHDLLEIIVNDFYERALLHIVLHYFIQALEIVLAVVFSDEIVEIHQEFRSCDCAHELR